MTQETYAPPQGGAKNDVADDVGDFPRFTTAPWILFPPKFSMTLASRERTVAHSNVREVRAQHFEGCLR